MVHTTPSGSAPGHRVFSNFRTLRFYNAYSPKDYYNKITNKVDIFFMDNRHFLANHRLATVEIYETEIPTENVEDSTLNTE